MGSDGRRLEVLRAIVQDYVGTREPVGSKTIVERHGLGVSPATVRNDMAYLEEQGYISQPHTSAGRIPTDRGYRMFVDQISQLKPLSAAERNAIERFLGQAVDLDDVLERTVRLLAQLTRQVAIIQYPSLDKSVLRHLELVALGSRSVLLVVITDSGRVEQRTVETAAPLPDLTGLRALLNSRLAGRRLTDLSEPLTQLARDVPAESAVLFRDIAAQLLQTLSLDAEERIVMAGAANLARCNLDFPHTIGPVLDALEEQVVMLRLISAMTQDQAITVSIGAENLHDGLQEASVVSATYGAADAPSTGALAVLGPTRMDYPGTMAAVRAVSRYVSEILNGR